MGNCRTTQEAAGGSILRQITSQFVAPTVLLLASWVSAKAQSPSCYAGFEVSQSCIKERGLDEKVAAYQHKITEAMRRLGASYKVSLRPVNDAETAGDVF